MNQIKILFTLLFILNLHSANSNNASVERALWVNQVIMKMHHYKYDAYLSNQKELARWFTSEAWINYTKANINAGFADVVQKNKWNVQAVPIKPPIISPLEQQHWKAVMPILVQFKNQKKEQFQTLEVSIEFGPAKKGIGVQGLSIASLQTKTLQPMCECALTQAKNNLDP